jgi:hypothetical protein
MGKLHVPRQMQRRLSTEYLDMPPWMMKVRGMILVGFRSGDGLR